jgi:hypothetical protein
MRGPPLQDGVRSGPCGRVLSAGDSPPPRVRVREALATLIVSHTPHVTDGLTKHWVRSSIDLTKWQVPSVDNLTKTGDRSAVNLTNVWLPGPWVAALGEAENAWTGVVKLSALVRYGIPQVLTCSDAKASVSAEVQGRR